jgi:hypothetical protein
VTQLVLIGLLLVVPVWLRTGHPSRRDRHRR